MTPDAPDTPVQSAPVQRDDAWRDSLPVLRAIADDGGWSMPETKFEAQPQSPFPLEKLPQSISDAITAMAYHADSDIATAAMVWLGAAATVVQVSHDVLTPDIDGGPKPTSLFTMAVAPSGAKKSTTFNKAFDPHALADKEVWSEWSDQEPEDRQWVEAPVMLVGDATIEAFANALDEGYPEQCWAVDDAGIVTNGYTWVTDTRRARAMNSLCKLWDRGNARILRATGERRDRSRYLWNKRASLCWLGTVLDAQDWLLGSQTARGFGARTILAHSDKSVCFNDENELSEEEAHRITLVLRDFQEWIAETRAQYKAERPERRTMPLSTEAFEILKDVYEIGKSYGQQLDADGLPISASVQHRIAEQSSRIAAVMAVNQGHSEVTRTDAIAAIAIARWSFDEWHRLEAGGAGGDLAKSHFIVVNTLRNDLKRTLNGEVAPNRTRPPYTKMKEGKLITCPIKTLIAHINKTPIKSRWKEIDFKKRLTNSLENEGIIRDTAEGWLVNPLILEEE